MCVKTKRMGKNLMGGGIGQYHFKIDSCLIFLPLLSAFWLLSLFFVAIMIFTTIASSLFIIKQSNYITKNSNFYYFFKKFSLSMVSRSKPYRWKLRRRCFLYRSQQNVFFPSCSSLMCRFTLFSLK